MGAWITVHGLLMVGAGIAFGLAVVRARVLPRWTGYALIAGVVLVAIASGLPELAQTAAAADRELAFIAMGWSLLRLQIRPDGT
jgi:Ca2+/Na+ antiporter